MQISSSGNLQEHPPGERQHDMLFDFVEKLKAGAYIFLVLLQTFAYCLTEEERQKNGIYHPGR